MIDFFKLLLKSIKPLVFAIAILTAFSLFSPMATKADNGLGGGMLDEKVNSADEDYGPYLIYGEKEDTLFFTSSRPVPKRRPIALQAEIFFSTRPVASRNTMQINEGWSKAQQIKTDANKIAEFTRGSQAISSDRIIFAAERDLSTSTSSGSSYLFDLWQMTKRLDGYTQPEPLTAVNEADSWESQPALSLDGKVLFFVTNRKGGMGGLDIWYSIMDDKGSWGKPSPVPLINTSGDEVSPHCGADGRFYFASNWDYKENKSGGYGKNIYRADYQSNPSGIALPINPVNEEDAIRKDAETYGLKVPEGIQYNSDKDDEFPFISPDRKSIFITSTRSAKLGKRNIYAFTLPKSKIKLLVNVTEQVQDANGMIIKPPTAKIGLPLSLVDESGVSQDIASGNEYEVDADKVYTVKFTKFVEQECYQNKIEGPNNLQVKTIRPYGFDTLFVMNAAITRRKVEIPPIVFNSTDTLPYFVTGYWYPNTNINLKEYRNRESNGFFNQTGFIDSSGHDYQRNSEEIDRNFENQIYKPLEKLLPAFQDFCRDTLYLKITIHGYTDPRGLSGGADHPYRPQSKNKHNYPDETVTIGQDSRDLPVTIQSGMDMWKQNWPLEAGNEKGRWVKLQDEGQNGNILLSKLRAYFTFVTFDRDMQQRSPIYTQMRNNGRVILDAEGFGIDLEGYKTRKLKDDPQSRRIEIYIDILRPEEVAYHKRLPGGGMKVLATYSTPKSAPLEQEPKVKESAKEAPKKELVKEAEPETEISIEVPESEVEKKVSEPEEAPAVAKEKKAPEPEEAQAEPEETKSEPEGVNTAPEESVVKEAEAPKQPIAAKPLPPPAEKPKELYQEGKEKDCYTIQYNSYDNKSEAETAEKILIDRNVQDVRLVEILDLFGERTYRLRSGCYQTPEEAVKMYKTVEWSTKELKLPKKPVIVR